MSLCTATAPLRLLPLQLGCAAGRISALSRGRALVSGQAQLRRGGRGRGGVLLARLLRGLARRAVEMSARVFTGG